MPRPPVSRSTWPRSPAPRDSPTPSTTPVASSFDAHRMLHLTAEHGAGSEFMDAVQRDLLGEGVNVYTAAYLANAATRAGVPAAGQGRRGG